MIRHYDRSKLAELKALLNRLRADLKAVAVDQLNELHTFHRRMSEIAFESERRRRIMQSATAAVSQSRKRRHSSISHVNELGLNLTVECMKQSHHNYQQQLVLFANLEQKIRVRFTAHDNGQALLECARALDDLKERFAVCENRALAAIHSTVLDLNQKLQQQQQQYKQLQQVTQLIQHKNNSTTAVVTKSDEKNPSEGMSEFEELMIFADELLRELDSDAKKKNETQTQPLRRVKELEAMLELRDAEISQLKRRLNDQALVSSNSKQAAIQTSTTRRPIMRNTVASVTNAHNILIWELPTGKCLHTLSGHSNVVQALEYIADGHRLASASADDSVKIWNLTSGVCERTLLGHRWAVMSMRSLGDGHHRLASCSWDKTIRVWDVNTGACLMVLNGHTGGIRSVEVVVDGQLVSASDDRKIGVWRADNGELLRMLVGHSEAVYTVRALDGGRLASGSEDRTIRLWQVDTGECIKTLVGHANYVTALEIIGKSKLVSGSRDMTIRVWSLDTGACVRTLAKQGGEIASLEVIDDNKLLSGSNDQSKMLMVWNLDTGECERSLSHLNFYAWERGAKALKKLF